MKVLFTFGGLPHYYNFVLSRLNSLTGVEVVVALPKQNNSTLGAGVKQSDKGINFKIVYLEEKKAFHGNVILKGLKETIIAESPDIIILIWPYILELSYNISLLNFIKKRGVKIILKEIPFMVPKYNDSATYYTSREALEMNENMIPSAKPGIKLTIKSKILAALRKRYYKAVDATVNYIDDAIDIQTSYGVSPEKIFITTNSPDTDLLAEARKRIESLPPIIPENKYRLIHVGRLVAWKRVNLIIKILPRLLAKYPETELVVIGTGPQKAELENLAKKLNVNNSVKFIGGIYDNDTMGRYMSVSAIYILAGMGGLSINEAMSFGKPVVCSLCDGTEKRLVRDNYNGLYFKKGDENSLFEKIDYLFAHQELIIKMGINSLQIIENEVNIHTVLNGYQRAFDYVMSN